MSCNKWLKLYPNDVMIETGSCTGSGIAAALDFGFKEVHSIEIDEGRYKMCKARFEQHPEVHLYLGKSVDKLPEILEKLNKQATFLLDAHVQDKSKEKYDKDLVCPVLEELGMVLLHGKEHNLKHSILVDDVKYFNGAMEGFDYLDIEDIEDIVVETKSSYLIENKGRYLLIR